MSSTVMVEDSKGVSITRFAGQTGIEYQVTWPSKDKDHLFDYVCFKTWEEAEAITLILKERLT